MNLRSKKELASRTLKVGKGRIVFIDSRKSEIKEAITKQDIRDLAVSGAIIIKNIKGRKKNERKKRYVIITRKLRNYLKGSSAHLSKEDIKKIRKKIKNREFKNKLDIKKYIENKEKTENKELNEK